MLTYLDNLINTLREAALENNTKLSNENISAISQLLNQLLKEIIISCTKGNPNDMVMPYSDAHRKRINLGHTLCILNKYLRHGMDH